MQQSIYLVHAHAPSLISERRLNETWPRSSIHDEPIWPITPLQFLACVGKGVCNNCGCGDYESRLKWCKGCFMAVYCSVECQRDHWKSEHRGICIKHQACGDKVRMTLNDTFLKFWDARAREVGRAGEAFSVTANGAAPVEGPAPEVPGAASGAVPSGKHTVACAEVSVNVTVEDDTSDT